MRQLASLFTAVACLILLPLLPCRADGGMRVLQIACDGTKDGFFVELFTLPDGQNLHEGVDLTGLQGQGRLVSGVDVFYRIDQPRGTRLDDGCEMPKRQVDVHVENGSLTVTETTKPEQAYQQEKGYVTVDLSGPQIGHVWDAPGDSYRLQSQETGKWQTCLRADNASLGGCTELHLHDAH